MKLPLYFLFTLLLIGPYVPAQTNSLNFQSLPSIPDKHGFAGMFAGVSNDVLICAGGANFPGNMPWEGGQKVWYDDIYILEEKEGEWKKSDIDLPYPLGYGVSVNYNEEVLSIGGSNENQHFNKVFGLEYANGSIKINDQYPDLPVPLAMMSGALVGDAVYIAGGIESADGLPTSHFYRLDLADSKENWHWRELKTWPGGPRQLSVAASKDGKFYLFSGIDMFTGNDGSTKRSILKDAYVYDPKEQTWSSLPELPRGVAAAPTPAPVMGLNHIVFAGGLDEETAKHNDPESHPGFLESILAFNTLSESYAIVGQLPEGGARVTLPTAYWDGDWILPNGETGPGVRSSEVFSISNVIALGNLNWLFLIIYIGFMVYMGYYFSKRGTSTNDFFKAGQRIPWWAAGLSIYGTQLSALTFMAVPALVYATDWTLGIGSLMILAIIPIIITFYLPFFRRLHVTTAYEYLETRFNVRVRSLTSVTFILMQLARMGIVMYIPAVAISSVTGIDIYLCLAIMGIICTIYTVMGGIEAVIWTDVVQVIVLLGGAIGCIIYAVMEVDGGFSEIISLGVKHDKFQVFHTGWDPARLVTWVVFVSFFFLNLIPFTSDQTIVQRYLTVKSEKEAAKSLWTNGLLVIPTIFIFFGLGTTLYVFYYENTEILASNRPDELLPFFIVQKLPLGISGIVIAALFSASMSSLDSSMNSISTAYVVDIHKHFKKGGTDLENLRLAKWVILIVGILGTGSAMLIAIADVEYIFDHFQALLGLFGGGLAGIFILAIFVRRANSIGAISGLFGSALITGLVKSQTDISGYLYGAVGVISCVIVGYVVSLMFYKKSKSNPLTYHMLVKRPK